MRKFMCLDELDDICQKCGFIDEDFVERDVYMVKLFKYTRLSISPKC